MAALTPTDYGEIRNSIYRAGLGKEELKALPALPTATQLLAAFQSLEDDMVSFFPTLKAGIDTELGLTTSNMLAQKIVAGYLLWKIKKLLGS